MPKITEAELKKQIKNKNFSPVYLIYGSEQLFVKKYTEMLTKAVAGKHPSDFNYHIFSGVFELDDFAASLHMIPFMSEFNCVLATDIAFDEMDKSSIIRLIDIISAEHEGTVLIISMPSYIPVKNKTDYDKFLKQTEKIGTVCEFEKLNHSMLEKYIAKWANENGKMISRVNAARLISYCGDDLNMLHNEIDKISAYTKSEEITLEDIEKLATVTLETRVYALSDAVLKGEGQNAYNSLDLLFYQKEEPSHILRAMCDAYVDAYRIRVANECGVLPKDVASDFAYRNRAFALDKARRATVGVSTEALRQSLDVLMEAEMRLKTTSVNIRIYMEQIIARLLLVAREGKQ
ncbi:MAG: DNA polymerase III subunit delta [Ruminococcus sp.]|nr:DNA polymerase III subunit delta [Ruminococcus sp.]